MRDIDIRAFLDDVRAEAPAFQVLALTAVCLAVAEYVFIPIRFHRFFPDATAPLAPFLWWSGGLLLVWVLAPYLLARRIGVARLGLSWNRLGRHLPLFGLLYLLTVGPVLLAATRPEFVASYPLIQPPDGLAWTWRLLWGYWALYAIQFFCVEFFFRGFLLFSLRPRFGYGAVAVMLVPYCMIHFHKPFPEALGAILGGAVLGWLALRLETIWGGVLLHVALALTMDAVALSRTAPGFPAPW